MAWWAPWVDPGCSPSRRLGRSVRRSCHSPHRRRQSVKNGERAQRFRNNVDALELAARQLDDVRGAIGRGAGDALVTFTTAVNQQLALELGRFLEGGESIRASITKLSQQIEKSREGKQDAAPNPLGPANQEIVQGNQTGR